MLFSLSLLLNQYTARRGSRKLQSLTSEERAQVLIKLAELLQSRKQEILSENNKDLVQAEQAGNALIGSNHQSVSSSLLYQF